MKLPPKLIATVVLYAACIIVIALDMLVWRPG